MPKKRAMTNDLIAYMLIVLIGFSLSSIYSSLHRSEPHPEITGYSEGIVEAYVLGLGLVRPVLNITLNPDNISSDLNWTVIPEADYFTVYYSDNLSVMLSLDPSSPPSYIGSINVSTSNWTDLAARSSSFRYYRVAAFKDFDYNLSLETVGTCYLDLVKGNNLVGLCMNSSYTAESFLRRISYTTNIPSLTKLERPSQTSELWVSKVRGFGKDYGLFGGKGYLLSVDKSLNYTIVGAAFAPFVLNLTKGNNLVSLDGNYQYTAESFLKNITWTTNRPSLTKLDRPSQTTELWVSKVRGFGKDYNMTIGKGYLLALDKDYNYTTG